MDAAYSIRAAKFAACVLFSALAAGCRPSAPSATAPADENAVSDTRRTANYQPPLDASLLFISLDTTRADHLGCYGYARPTSPHIDRLAAQGWRFERAYTVMPTTLPSHASMFTSLYPSQLGTRMNTDIVPPQANTLAERLKAAGFATGAFVGAYPMDAAFGLNQGFDVYQCPPKSEWRAPRVRQMAQAWLTAHASKRFFCFVHFYDPHTYYEPPASFAHAMGASGRRMPPEFEFLRKPEQFTPDVVRDTIASYDAEIAMADAQIGELLAALDASPARDRTIVVFVSDHGETMDELLTRYSYAFDHGEFLYRRELRIPLILRLPQAFAHRGPGVIEGQASTLDLMPTLLELLSLTCDGPVEGESLVPLLAGEKRPTRRVCVERHEMPGATHAVLQGGEWSIVDGRWHWILSPARGEEMFDLESDPLEGNNVAAKHHEYRKMMRADLARWQESKSKPLWGRRTAKLTSAERDRMKALGYLSGGDATPASTHSTQPSTSPASQPPAPSPP